MAALVVVGVATLAVVLTTAGGSHKTGQPAARGARAAVVQPVKPKAPAAPAAIAKPKSGVPQNNGGDSDPDNNGGPDDGDGNL